MSSTLNRKQDSHLRIVSSEDAVVFPENATPTDDAPTVISKTSPGVDAGAFAEKKNQLVELTRQSMSPESLVASLRGRRLAHYELIEPIGVGGMAAVIRARDTQLDRFVALKILPPETAFEIENVQRFHQEAKAAAKLDHENIARVFYCGEDQGLHFIAFEFVEGTNLRAVLERRGALPVGEAISYVLQIAAGLEHAANRGVVHRDVKPSNIIIMPSGRAKLVDMGLARNLERHAERDLTQSGVTLGTFDYISPEQALEPREADSRSDVYSLGCTMYHMLTGRPPVPEGTPAKKLNHHQHIAPIDPRLINPLIPEEVVQVLGKMMAKHPKDRYQKPILLVHHLMQVAQKVGATNEAAEGMLFLESPVPAPPRSRPLLVIGLALVSLVALVLILSLASDPRSHVPVGPPANPVKDKVAVAPNTDVKKFPDKKPRVATAHAVKVTDAKGLQAVLADRSMKEVKASIEGKINLENAGLSYQPGDTVQRLEIDSYNPHEHATISFRYQPDGDTAGLLLDSSEEVIFRRIKFQIDSETTPDVAVAAVTVRGAKRVLFDRCVFIQNVQPISRDRTPLGAILIEAAEESNGHRPQVILRDCGFEGNSQTGGQVAIAIDGPAEIQATNCGFKPHGAFFHVRNNSTAANTTIHLKRCAGFVVKGPVFRLDEHASARLQPENCVFSNHDGSVGLRPELATNLIYHVGNAPILFIGKNNLYHDLNYLVGTINKEPDFQKYLAASKGCSDEKSVHLSDRSASPWAASQPLDDKLGALAFQLRAEYHSEFGIAKSWLGEMPKALAAKNIQMLPKFKIVDADDPTPGIQSNLAQALSGAHDGDIFHIKHGDGHDVKVEPATLKRGMSVTLRPHDGHQPILVIDKSENAKDSYLFKVPAGKLTIENLEISLDPGNADFDVRSIVQLGEGAQCAFKNCTISLRGASKVRLYAVSFLDVANMAKMDGPPPPPSRVEFSECFVRGKGDLVNLRGSQLLNVDVKHSLVVLAGQLLDITGDGKATPPDRIVHWKMDHSSVFTTESVFALRSDTGKGLSKTQAEANSCLFVALAADQPIVLPDMEREDALATYLDWKGEKNFYAGFAQMGLWKERYSEPTTSIYESARLMFPKLDEDPTQKLQALWDITPELLKPADADSKRLNGFGVPAELVEQRWMPAAPKTDEP